MTNVCVIGGGAAGMMAAIAAAENGAKVTILEKNEKLGKKLFITGKGRCNLTNACDREDFFKNVFGNNKFLFSSFDNFDNQAVFDWFEAHGCKCKVERGNRVFPESDKSSDVIKALKDEILRKHVSVFYNCTCTGIEASDSGFKVSTLENGRKRQMAFDKVIICTGGLSYPQTGSTGDGYRFAEHFGHSMTPTVPSLVAVETEEDFPKRLMGLSLKNVSLTLIQKGKKIYKDLGEMLFTHFGVSGPLVLTSSCYIADAERYGKEIPVMVLDMKPGMSVEELDARILKDFGKQENKNFENSLDGLLPQSMVPEIVKLSGIDPYKKVNSVTKEERRHLAELLKGIELHVSGLRSFPEAIITKGGVALKEINPKTMESKLCPGLYFAGEVMDLDAVTGGFNLQIAWSTGFAAGTAAAEQY